MQVRKVLDEIEHMAAFAFALTVPPMVRYPKADPLGKQALNDRAAEVMQQIGVHAATDITGFGLLGHLHAMAIASGVSMAIEHKPVEFLPGALDYSRQGYLPGGLKNNVKFLNGCVQFDPGVPQEIRNLLFDPQTSGGLLLVVNKKDAAALVKKLAKRGVPASEVGRVVEKTSLQIRVE